MRRILSWLKEHLPSAVLGAILGAGIGYCVSQIQQRSDAKTQREYELRTQTQAVFEEFDFNKKWGTNSLAWRKRGDSLIFKRLYSIDAMTAFMNDIPRLLPDEDHLHRLGSATLSQAHFLNQMIQHRNMLELIPFNQQQGIKALDAGIKDLMVVQDSLELRYRDSLRNHISD